MGAMLSAEAGVESTSRLASRDVCDEETWGNTLRNRSTHTVHDHLGGLVSAAPPPRAPLAALLSDPAYDEFALSFADPPAAPAALAVAAPAPASPASSSSSLDSLASGASARRRRLEFAPEDEVAFYCADAPPQEMFGRDQVRVL